MRSLAILTACLVIGAITWLSGSSHAFACMVDDKFPTEVQKLIDDILATKYPYDRDGSFDKSTCFSALFSKVGAEGVTKLQNYPDDTIALQAAWEELELLTPINERVHPPKLDHKKLDRFISFVEKRCKVKPPAWWLDAMHEFHSAKRYHIYRMNSEVKPYHDSGLKYSSCPLNTTITQNDAQVTLKIEKDVFSMSNDLFTKLKKEDRCDGISALLTPSHCYLAMHEGHGYPYPLTSIERSSRKIQWSSKAWGSWWHSSSGAGNMYVSVMKHEDRVVVFGVADQGFHIEGFDAETGKNLFRVSNSYGR